VTCVDSRPVPATCPNSCNKHGVCRSMANIAKYEGWDNSQNIPGGVGDGLGPTYDAWDANMTYGCVCDPGFSGPDCSLFLCPHGDDPRTEHQQDRVVVLTTANSDSGEDLSGTFFLQIGAVVSDGFDADGSVTTAALMKAHLEAMPNIHEARVVRGSVAANKATSYTIALKFNSLLYTNNMYVSRERYGADGASD